MDYNAIVYALFDATEMHSEAIEGRKEWKKKKRLKPINQWKFIAPLQPVSFRLAVTLLPSNAEYTEDPLINVTASTSKLHRDSITVSAILKLNKKISNTS